MSIQDESGTGFVVTHIPKSYLAPHQCLHKAQYYMRAGSSFFPVPHGVLAGMFGRVPQPEVFHMWISSPAQFLQDGSACFKIGLQLTNHSPVIARDAYLNLTIDPPGGKSTIAPKFPDLQHWDVVRVLGCITQALAKGDFRLAPQSFDERSLP